MMIYHPPQGGGSLEKRGTVFTVPVGGYLLLVGQQAKSGLLAAAYSFRVHRWGWGPRNAEASGKCVPRSCTHIAIGSV